MKQTPPAPIPSPTAGQGSTGDSHRSHPGSRHVSQLLCEKGQASAYHQVAHGMSGRGVIFHDSGQGPLPGIANRNPLADPDEREFATGNQPAADKTVSHVKGHREGTRKYPGSTKEGGIVIRGNFNLHQWRN